MILKSVAWLILVPAVVLGLALWMLPWAESLPAAVEPLRRYLPYVLLLAAMLMSLGFNQTRLFFGLLLSTLLLLLLQGDTLVPAGLNFVMEGALENLAGLLLPPALLTLLLLQERGLFTLAGLGRWALVLLLPLLMLLLAQQDPWLSLEWMKIQFLPAWISSPLSDWVVSMYVLVFGWMLSRLAFYHGVAETGFIGLLLGSALALHFYPSLAHVQVMFSAAAIIVIVAIMRASLHLAYRDELTGLPTRRALGEQLLKLGRRYSIAMLDIDHFKKFNDKYGHDVGDQVLKMVASHIARTGGGSKSFRYGGEEFTLLFPGKDCDAAETWLEELRQTIAAKEFVVRTRQRPRRKPKEGTRKARRLAAAARQNVRISISIGIVDNENEEMAPEDVIKAADADLYRAKKKGRNRVCR